MTEVLSLQLGPENSPLTPSVLVLYVLSYHIGYFFVPWLSSSNVWSSAKALSSSEFAGNDVN